ncbi:MAG TPA: serine/threonine-protein kinase [Polyangiaceae bacterium]|nr:serine/threonine-protein kinase [Polyangiaceae bacterium]
MVALTKGRVIAGRYALERCLARGGMGSIWVARHLALDTLVAAKFINTRLVSSPIARVRFEREARAAAQLQSPHVVHVHDYGVEEDTPYLVMELLHGEDLGTRLRRVGTLPPPPVAEILVQAARALRRAHEAGIIHRDIKPGNVFLAQDDDTELVKLLDFGIAKAPSLGTDSEATKTGQVLGSPHYMSPEQARGLADVDHRSDLWGLAAVVYRALTGALPFPGEEVYEVLLRICSEPALPPSRHVPHLPPELDRFFERALAKVPSDRFQSALELAEAFAEAARRWLPSEGAANEPHAFQSRVVSVGPPDSPADAGRSRMLQKRRSSSVTAAPDRLASDDDFWVTLETGRSSFHAARRHARAGPSRPWVLVFVVAAEAAVRWSRLARSLVLHEDSDFDVLLLQLDPDAPVSVPEARMTIELASTGALNVVVVADEPGALLLRQILEQDYAAAIEGLASGRVPDFDRSVALRTRQIVMIAGSDPGGWGTTVSLDDRAGEIERAYEARATEAAAIGLPCPLFRAFGARHLSSDDTPGGRNLEDSAARSLSGFLRLDAYAGVPDQLVALETIRRSLALDRAAQIGTLIGDAAGAPGGEGDVTRPTLDYATAGTQRGVHDQILALLRKSSARPRRLVVAGDVGVGKSTALRTLGRRLALEFQQDVARRLPLPIVCPLQQESLDAEDLKRLAAAAPADRGRLLLTTILRRWCDWANALLSAYGPLRRGDLVTSAWLETRVRDLPTVLVLDGVDEFLTNNAGVGLSEFREMLQHITSEFSHNGDLVVVLGVRSSQPGIRMLASSTNHIFEILHLTTAQAQERFPGIARLLGSVADPDVRRLLLTPLLLSWLGPRSTTLTERSLQTPAEVIEQALLAIIEESHLTDIHDADEQSTDADRWMDAVTLVGWIFQSKLRGDIAVAELRAEATAAAARWRAFSERCPEDEAAYLLAAGFDLVADSRASEALLKRSVFFPTGLQRVRFMHREWQDFLAARYLAACIRTWHVDELRVVGISPHVHKTAGELLCKAGVVIDEPLVRHVLSRAVETGDALIAANFNALIASSRVPMDGPAIDALIAALDHMKPVARCIALNGVSYRALRDDDPAARDLRQRLIPIYEGYLSPGAPRDAMMASISWCYMKAFAQRFRTRAPAIPWPGLGDDLETQHQALQVVSTLTENGPRVTVENRSVQVAFLRAQYLAATDSHRPISAVHYLYHLVVARRHDAHVAELARELPAIFDPDSPVAEAIRGYLPVPELATVFETCRRIHDSA